MKLKTHSTNLVSQLLAQDINVEYSIIDQREMISDTKSNNSYIGSYSNTKIHYANLTPAAIVHGKLMPEE